MFNGFLIQSYPPQNDVTVAHHITVGINPDFDLSLEPDFTGLTIPKDSEITARVTCPGLEVFDVSIDGNVNKPPPDGRPFHITYSRDSAACVPIEMYDYLTPSDQEIIDQGEKIILEDRHANNLIAMVRDYQSKGLTLPEGYSFNPVDSFQIAHHLRPGFFKVEENGSFSKVKYFEGASTNIKMQDYSLGLTTTFAKRKEATQEDVELDQQRKPSTKEGIAVGDVVAEFVNSTQDRKGNEQTWTTWKRPSSMRLRLEDIESDIESLEERIDDGDLEAGDYLPELRSEEEFFEKVLDQKPSI